MNNITLQMNEISKSFPGVKALDSVSFDLIKGETHSLVGENGAGKSTLIKVMTDRLAPMEGTVKIGRSVKYAYLEQDVEFSHKDTSVLEEVCNELDMSISSSRNLLGKFLFFGDSVYKKIGILSGGEKSRLRLLLEMRDSVNFLVLDEPTNHLDISSREDLEKAIRDYGGTMIFISHDRHFINAFADKIFEIRQGKFAVYPGNYDNYLEKTASTESVKTEKRKSSEKLERGKAKRKASFTLRMTEEKIQKLEQKINKIEEEIQEFAANYIKLTKLTTIRENLKTELDEQYEKWMDLTNE